MLRGRSPRRLPSMPTPLVLDAARLLHLVPKLGQPFQLSGGSLEIATRYWYADASKARAELGFAPRDPSKTLAAAVSDLLCPGPGR